MNDGLIDAFRHNAWSTRILLDVCEKLTDEQLNAYVPGTFASIHQTLWHYIDAENGYCKRLTGEESTYDWQAEVPPTVALMLTFNDELEDRWIRFLSKPFDAERTFIVPWNAGVERDVPAGIVFMQAIHHGSEHRAQVATILTSIGIEPPGWGLWEFGADTNRAPVRVT